LVELQPYKLEVAGSRPVFRSTRVTDPGKYQGYLTLGSSSVIDESPAFRRAFVLKEKKHACNEKEAQKPGEPVLRSTGFLGSPPGRGTFGVCRRLFFKVLKF
jgi:hypothetical protein